jgi:hypothetical protein
MAPDVSTGFAALRLALMRPLSCSSFRLSLQAGWPMARHVACVVSTRLKNV